MAELTPPKRRDPLKDHLDQMRHLRLPVFFTRAGMVAERVMRVFWPLWTVVFIVLAPLMMGWEYHVSLEVFWGLAVLSLIAISAALIWGLRRFRMPTTAEAVARVDAAMPGRPIAAIADTQAIGSGDAASEAVWQAHMARMADRTKAARAVEPDLRIADRDPYGLRFIALLFFVTALLFGSLLRVGSVGEITTGRDVALAAGPVWEGWVEPPAYTGKPTLYLNDIAAGKLDVVAGSTVTLRLYGQVGALMVAETVSGRVGDVGSATDAQQSFDIVQSGHLSITGENGIQWQISVLADTPPTVELTGPVEADAFGEMTQPFEVIDDYGVEHGTATIALDLDAVDRRHGLSVDPDPIAPLVLDLPMPFNGDRSDFDELLIDNLSEHPLANLPVTLQLSVTDAAGQTSTSAAESLILPGRRFFQPFAKAVIEQRRDLMWSDANTRRVSQILRAISHRPEGLFSNEALYLRLRTVIRSLDDMLVAGIDEDAQTEVAQALWDLAVQLEDGRLADARERLERAQDRLEEAMRSGASDEEIAELMQELREATNDYMQLLAEESQSDENGADQPDGGADNTQVTMDEIQALMDRIQELMQEGRMAEAQELMEQLNEMMENMRVTQGESAGGEGPQSPGQQMMQDLAETLDEQQDLSDDAFQDLQDQFNEDQNGQDGQQQPSGQGENGQQGESGEEPSQQGQNGQQPGTSGPEGGDEGQSGQNGEGDQEGDTGQSGQQGADAGRGQSLSDRQQGLREELQRQRNGLGDSDDTTDQLLDLAEDAMEGAEEALRNGDLAGAIDQQAQAMDALREGMNALGQSLAENNATDPGQDAEPRENAGNGSPTPGGRDPLGRQTGNAGTSGTEQDMLDQELINRRAEELLDEIRRRSSEQDRPEIERDYLRRLLDQF